MARSGRRPPSVMPIPPEADASLSGARAPRAVQVMQTVSVHYSRHGGRTHSDIARAKESPAGTGAPRTSEITIGVSEDDLRVIAEHGYEGATSTDHDQQAQAVSLFITDMLAGSTGQGNGVTTCNAVSVVRGIRRLPDLLRSRIYRNLFAT
jgi:hypothetical protein